MLDTVQVKHYFTKLLSEDELLDRGAKSLSKRRFPTFVLNPERHSALPRLTILFTPDNMMHVSAECSIPKLLFGHNARLPNQDEVNEGLQCLCDFVEARTGLDFLPETATVSLIHFSRDIQLGEPGVYRAVEMLSKGRLSRFNKIIFEDVTIYFRNKGNTKLIRIYPKLQEVLSKQTSTPDAIEAARGNLRFEYCLLKKTAVDSYVKKIDLPDSTAQSLLTMESSKDIFSQLFEELRFPDLLTNTRSNLEMLREHFTTRKAMNLSGFLDAVNQNGENFYKDEAHDFSKDAYYRAARECRKAGVWSPKKSLE